VSEATVPKAVTPQPPDPRAESAIASPHPPPQPEPEPEPINLGRIAWALTTIGFLLAALVLLVSRRYGYSEVTFAVAIGAAINLF
jgi:hypothetical protein